TEKLRAFLPPPKEVTATQPDEETTRRLALFDGKETIGLADYWSYKKPFGFILKGRPYPRKRNWIDLYQKLCEVLRELDAERFDSIPDCREIISTHGKPYFSKDHHTLRSPMKVAEGVYAESNLSANLIRDNILRLLKIFEISKEKLTIYLRY
ncbi:MAG: hypothetical protein GQ522_04930, partial [Deltaproteobacteria bacterium]|nr:hypothetical protein [Deltaproteobacteria bacterium]